MSDIRKSIIAGISEKLPFGAVSDAGIGDDTNLSEIGVTSLHLITIIVALQREYSFDIASLTQSGMPTTVGDLVTLIEQYHASS
jgi:acyl carrier protein